jgi:hypothetical protein
VGPQGPKYVARDLYTASRRFVKELAALKGDAIYWPTGPEYAPLRLRLEISHAAGRGGAG